MPGIHSLSLRMLHFLSITDDEKMQHHLTDNGDDPKRETFFERETEVLKMKIWFTITGTGYRYGQDFLEKGMKVRLEKEPDNEYDREAIRVTMEGLGHIGYVANSPKTVIGDSWSAGRLYDKIGHTANGKVFMVMDKGVLCHTKVEDREEQ